MDENNFYAEYNQNGDEINHDYSREIAISSVNVGVAKSFIWMFIAMLVTMLSGRIVGTLVSATESYESLLFLIIFAFIVQLVLSFVITKESLVKSNFSKSLALLMVYAILEGVMFSCFFILFDMNFLYQIFGFVGLYFLLLGGITYLFKNKLTRIRDLASAGFITLIIASIAISLYSIFFVEANYGISWTLFLGISVFAILVFSIIAIADMKSIANLMEYSTNQNAASVAGAFTLYLDFIIIFQYILRIAMLFAGNKGKK